MTLLANPLPRFREHTIGAGLKGGYQVIAADMNADGKPDLIALASGMSELVWYENPGWERHVIVDGQSRMINVAALERPGRPPTLVLAAGFDPNPARSAGILSVLEPGDGPRAPWKQREIDRLPTSHRLRAADIDGSGRKVIVNAPLAHAQAAPPDYRGKTPLVLYRPGAWKRELIDEQEDGVMHGIYVLDWDGDGRDEILTASFAGIHLYDYDAGRWKRTALTPADPAPWPKSGASDVAVGHLGKRRFLCAIEPWHGHQVTVYTQDQGAWQRQVIDSSLIDGHTIHAADLNGDGRDEIVAGCRAGARSVYLFTAEDGEGRSWKRHALDEGGMAAASCLVEDLNADGRPDLACIGTSTANLKWYENLK